MMGIGLGFDHGNLLAMDSLLDLPAVGSLFSSSPCFSEV